MPFPGTHVQPRMPKLAAQTLEPVLTYLGLKVQRAGSDTLSQRQNFKLVWLPYLTLMRSVVLLIPRWLENRGQICFALGCLQLVAVWTAINLEIRCSQGGLRAKLLL